jgi:hypothetical protein
LFHTYILPPDGGLQMGPKLVEALQLNKVTTNSASCWFIAQYREHCFALCLQLPVTTNCDSTDTPNLTSKHLTHCNTCTSTATISVSHSVDHSITCLSATLSTTQHCTSNHIQQHSTMHILPYLLKCKIRVLLLNSALHCVRLS